MHKNVLQIALYHAHDYAFKASKTMDKLRILEMKKKKNQHNVKGKEENIEIQ